MARIRFGRTAGVVAAAGMMAITGSVAVPRAVGATAVGVCVGAHSWTLPDTTTLVTSFIGADTWSRNCANVDTTKTPFPWNNVSDGYDAGGGTAAPYTGNCLVGFQPWFAGERVFVGGVTVALSPASPTASEVGVLGVPSSLTPCLGPPGSSIVWSGYAVTTFVA